MEYVIKNREPEILFRFFEDISRIPRGSGNEQEISDYLVAFAKERGLEYEQDKIGNVVIRKKATPGRESEPSILLQGHMDMVCEKNKGVVHDFTKDPIKLRVEGKYLRACGTTLGADNGVAVVFMLASLDGAIQSHPELECLFTVSEETGLDGANAFDAASVRARKMINLDSENINYIIASCSGGLRSNMYIPAKKNDTADRCIKITVSGLAGGHSGENINCGRANANKLMGRILFAADSKGGDCRISSVDGGNKENAIPRECVAVVSFKDIDLAKAEIIAEGEKIRGELNYDDAAFSLNIEDMGKAEVFCSEESKKIISIISVSSNGVLSMHRTLKNIPEYSRNLGIIETDDQGIKITYSSRSPVESLLDASTLELDALAYLCGGSTEHYNRYPGWDFADVSPLRDEYISAYKRVTGKTPDVIAIHAGLECGIIKSKIPDMDIISIGPNMSDLHSPDETLDLDSCELLWKIFSEMLSNRA